MLGNVKIGNKVKLMSKAMLHGNDIVIRDGVRIGTGAVIEDNCAIGPNVKVGEGAFIHKGSGEITEHVPPHSQVFRDDDGALHVADGVPEQHRRSRRQEFTSAGYGEGI